MVAITATHYMPGYTIALPLSSGSKYDFDNYAVRTLPDGGFDAGREGAYSPIGYNTVTFNIIGEGRTVYFTISCPGGGDASMALYVKGVTNGNTSWDAVASITPAPTPVEMSYLMTSGVQYYLDVGGASYYSDEPNGHPFDRQFHLEVSYTTGGAADEDNGEPPVNDLRENATVINPGTDNTWVSADVNITHATSDTDDYGDPWSLGYDQSVWWRYTAKGSGTATVVALNNLSSPDPAFNIQVLDASNGDSLIKQSPMGTFTISLIKNHTYFFCIGVSGTRLITQYVGVTVGMGITVPTPGTSIPVFNPVNKPFLPNIPQVPDTDPTKETRLLIDLIRDFSSKIRTAVRVTSVDRVPNRSEPFAYPFATIELVDPDATNTMQSMDPHFLYSAAEDTQKAGETKFSAYGTNQLYEAEATLVNNDATILLSGWQIPDYLPVLKLESSPIQSLQPVRSVRLSFTPESFTGSIVFYPPHN